MAAGKDEEKGDEWGAMEPMEGLEGGGGAAGEGGGAAGGEGGNSEDKYSELAQSRDNPTNLR